MEEYLEKHQFLSYKSIVSYNEKVDDDHELDLVEKVLPCLKDFTQLQSFGCTADPDYYTHTKRFIPYLPYITNITKLDLSGSNLEYFDQAKNVSVIIMALPNLTELNLLSCFLEMRIFKIILPAIQNLKNLISLNVSDNEDFCPADITEIKRLFDDLAVLKI